MKKRVLRYCLMLLLFLVAGCTSSEPTATPEIAPTTEVEATAPVVLELAGPGETKSFTMDDLKALLAIEGWSGGKSSTGSITPPELHKGVTLQELCAQIGGLQPGQGVNIVAKDGYAMTFSYDQIVNGEFITYDPGTGDEITIDDPLQVIVAYERSGQPISPDADGPLRLAILSAQNNQVVDGHWTVKWVTRIEIKDMAEDWTLHLEGALTEEMDRATFESCAAANCHRATWSDDEGQVWTGVPLWLLAGRIDGGDRHGDEAYDETMAARGYTLDVVAADGYSASFESTRFDHNDAILLAYLVNGEMLGQEHFPLRLVGAELTKKELIGQVVQIVAQLPAEAAETSVPQETVEPPPEAWTLQLEGALSEEIDWTAFDACANCHRATWTDDEGQVWTGVPLWQLTGRVDDDKQHGAGAYNQELAEQGYTLEVVAADGYSVPLENARFSRDDSILMAYRVNDAWLSEKHFPLRLVGVGLQKNEMVGQIARIAVQLPPSEAAAAPAPEAPAGDTALEIVGAVAQEQAFSLAALQSLDVVEISVEHPKKGMQTYRGMRLSTLLDLAGIQAGAARVIMLASDGYQTQVSLADVQACADCLIAFDDSGTLNMVMPGMESGLWAKDVVKIELQ